MLILINHQLYAAVQEYVLFQEDARHYEHYIMTVISLELSSTTDDPRWKKGIKFYFFRYTDCWLFLFGLSKCLCRHINKETCQRNIIFLPDTLANHL